MSHSGSYRVNALLSLVRHATDTSSIDRLHAGIEEEIRAAAQRTCDAEARCDPEYLDAVTDDECNRVEELLGLAFVAAQMFITRFRSRVDWASSVTQEQFGKRLSFASHAKEYDVLARGHPLKVNPAYTTIEVIHAVANYWKHEEDWPTREEARDGRLIIVWDDGSKSLRTNEKRTIEIAVSIGMVSGSTGNLRTAAKVLGVTDYANLSPIREELKDWAHSLYAMACSEISQWSGDKS